MSEAQGASSQLWQSLKQTLSLKSNEDTTGEADVDGQRPSEGRLSSAEADNLPRLRSLKSGTHASGAARQSKDHKRSSSWIKRLSNRKPSSEKLASTQQPDDWATHQNGTAGLASEGVATDYGARREFLERYDTASLELYNRLSGSDASCLADTAFQEVAPWNRASGHLGHLDEHQKKGLDGLRAAFPESTRWHTDHDLLRFLRAREFDLRKAKEMYKKYVEEYRGKLMVTPNPPVRPTKGPFDTKLVELYPERAPEMTTRLQKMMDWFLHTIAFGMDKDGRPVVFFRPGDILNQKMNKFVPVADRIAFQSSSNEMAGILTKMASHKAGFHIDSIVQVLDFGGMSAMQMISHMRSPDAQQEWQHNLDYNPEMLHKIYIISAPSGMPLIWKVASPFLPANTVKKVEVLGSDYQKVLQKAIGSENLPSCYGGKVPFEWPKHRSTKELKY